jgi:hypothetical protein
MIFRILRDKNNNIESIAIVSTDITKDQPILLGLYKDLLAIAKKRGLILSDAKQKKNGVR